ncbi:MAG: hypothetical protein L0Y44_10515 [Phycisphaerales bacterium]|nr:hypothetical protein [Phycisphaerales bacterium]
MTLTAHEREITVNVGPAKLPGTLTIPVDPIGTVLFAHGSGSGRLSPRNLAVAYSLVDRHGATFLFDLLTPLESQDRRNVFDIDLLASRMLAATERVRQIDEVVNLPIGYFGASTGAAAALVAAAELGDQVSAIVSRGGRPDLAGDSLGRVTAPTLFLVGSLDQEVLELNRRAQIRMHTQTKLIVIPDATHLFEEPGKLEEVARHAGLWFEEHFTGSRNSAKQAR